MKIILCTLLLGSCVTAFAGSSCTNNNPIEQPSSRYDKIVTIVKKCLSEFNTASSKNFTVKELRQVANTCFKPLRDHIQSLSLDDIQKSKQPITETTLLMLAVELVDLELISILLNKGVNVNEENRSGISALNMAYGLSYEPFIEIITILLNHGANINHYDSEGFTTAHIIALQLKNYKNSLNQTNDVKHKIWIQKMIDQVERKLEFLKTHGADFTIKNRKETSVNDILTAK